MRHWWLLLLVVPGVQAHGDQADWSGTWTLAPGEEVAVERPVHWHRVFGSWDADGEVAFLVDGEPVQAGRSARIAHLVACCNATWTDLSFALRNTGDADVTVHADVHFVHDNLAVVVDDAEPGAWWQTSIILLALLGIPALMRRPMEGESDPWLRMSRWLHGAAWGLALTTALIGMVRFRSGPVVGSIGATAGYSIDLGAFLNLHALAMMTMMGLWGAAYACLDAARRRGAQTKWDHGVFLAGTVLVGFAWMVEMGANWITWVVVLAPSLVIAADFWAPMRDGAET